MPWFASDQILTSALAYQTGPLGNYYYRTNGVSGSLTNLFDTGSAWALDDGLFSYTTTTNQMPEGGTMMVDIGYHDVAIDPSTGQPYDWYGDGILNYMYDAGSFLKWWLFQYSGLTDNDPYTFCPPGDGWTLLDAYENGWNPLVWQTPPAPSNFTASLLDGGAPVALN